MSTALLTTPGMEAALCSACKGAPHTSYSHECKSCRAAYMRSYLNRGENRQRFNDLQRERMRVRRDIVRDITRTARDVPCADCGGRFHFVAMHFDHVRGEKRHEISAMVRSHYSLDRIQAEIDKCDVVCANCHSVRTWKRGQYGATGFQRKDAAL